MGDLLRITKLFAIVLSIVLLAACGSSVPGDGDVPPDLNPVPPIIPGPPPDPVPPGPPPVDPEPPELPPPGIRSLLTLVNEFRAQPQTCGNQTVPAAPPLTWNNNLEVAAQRHSEYMAESGVLKHIGRGGTDVGQRASAAGYSWSWIGENVASRYREAADVHGGWVSSPLHCLNLMNPYAVHLGVARAYSAAGVPFWTQVLARPR